MPLRWCTYQFNVSKYFKADTFFDFDLARVAICIFRYLFILQTFPSLSMTDPILHFHEVIHKFTFFYCIYNESPNNFPFSINDHKNNEHSMARNYNPSLFSFFIHMEISIYIFFEDCIYLISIILFSKLSSLFCLYYRSWSSLRWSRWSH